MVQLAARERMRRLGIWEEEAREEGDGLIIT